MVVFEPEIRGFPSPWSAIDKTAFGHVIWYESILRCSAHSFRHRYPRWKEFLEESDPQSTSPNSQAGSDPFFLQRAILYIASRATPSHRGTKGELNRAPTTSNTGRSGCEEGVLAIAGGRFRGNLDRRIRFTCRKAAEKRRFSFSVVNYDK